MSTFIMLSGVPYDSMRQRPQHLADALVRLGHQVVFIALNHYKEVDKDSFIQLLANKMLLENMAKEPFRGLLSLEHVCYRENDYLLGFDLVLEYLEKECEAPIFYVGYPDAVVHLDRLSPETTVIYDCMDDWEQFVRRKLTSHKDSLYLAALERRLALRADLVITTAMRLYAKLAPYANRIGYLPNTVRKQDYDLESEFVFPDHLQGIPHPRVVFVGALHNWIDFDLIRYLAEKRPNYSYVIIGPNYEKAQSPTAANIYYLGKKPYSTLPHYLKHARVAIIPFKVDKLSATVTPLKFYEYLAAGVPTVTTAFPDLVGFPGALMASDYQDFLNKLDYIINMDCCSYTKLAVQGREAISQLKLNWDLSAKLMVDWASGKSSPPAIRQQLAQWIEKLERHRDKDVVCSQLVTLYNLCGQYTEAVSASQFVNEQTVLDHEQLALALFYLGQFEQAIEQLSCYFNMEEGFDRYLNRVKSHEQSLLATEVLLLKCCNRHLEAVDLLSQALNSRSDVDPLLLGLLLELNLEVGEWRYATTLAARLVEQFDVETLVAVLSPQAVLSLIRQLISERYYAAAESLLLKLDAESNPKVAKLLGELYLSYYTFEHDSSSKERK